MVFAVSPLCECHNEPMLWNKNTRCRAGGSWYCAVKAREGARRYKKVHRDRVSESDRRYREANPEKYRKWTRIRACRYRAAHPGRVRKSKQRWYETHPIERSSHERIRRARKRGAETDGHSRAEVFERDGGKCQMCGRKLRRDNWHEDHIVPLSRGGSDLLDNCQAACPPCNLSKWAHVA